MKHGSLYGVLGAVTFLGVGALAVSACTITTDNGGLLPPGESACNSCLFEQCSAQQVACTNNTACRTIYKCAVNGCAAGDGPCVQGCIDRNPSGSALYTALYTCDDYGLCACRDTCGRGPALPETFCSSPVPDAGPGPVDAGPVLTCNACKAQFCSSQNASCSANSECDKYTNCLLGCGTDATCYDNCGTSFPVGKTASDALNACMASSCATLCSF